MKVCMLTLDKRECMTFSIRQFSKGTCRRRPTTTAYVLTRRIEKSGGTTISSISCSLELVGFVAVQIAAKMQQQRKLLRSWPYKLEWLKKDKIKHFLKLLNVLFCLKYKHHVGFDMINYGCLSLSFEQTIKFDLDVTHDGTKSM